MAKQVINIGTVANDGTGDPLRTAFDKVNDNFTENYDAIGLRLRGYSLAFNLIGTDVTPGIVNTIITTLTTKPYSFMLVDVSGNYFTETVDIEETTINGFYAFNIICTDSMNNNELRICY